MNATLIMALALVLAPGDFEVEPRLQDWQEARQPFDAGWLLPMPQLRQSAGRNQPRDLTADLEGLLEACLDPASQRRLGDLLGEEPRPPSASARDTILRLARAHLPARWSDLRTLLRPDWDPDDSSLGDGILVAKPWDLGEVEHQPWSELGGKRRELHQGAVLIFADLPTIKAAENDFRGYSQRNGTAYTAIYPVPGRYFRGALPDASPYTFHELYFAVDLPFPFGGYECLLKILHRVDGGRVFADVYSTSEDFYWLVGRDVYLPVKGADGQTVATIVIKYFGFDLRGVPDRSSDVLTALRSSLGHLKRESEARPAEASGSGSLLPSFTVLGRR